jgi:hypothetical protein
MTWLNGNYENYKAHRLSQPWQFNIADKFLIGMVSRDLVDSEKISKNLLLTY